MKQIQSLLFILAIFSPAACKKDETLDRASFLGSYNATEDCTPGQSFFTSVSASATSDEEVVIFNFGNFDIGVKGKISGNNITVPSQTFNKIAGGVELQLTVSGQGSISGETLTISYTWTEANMGGTDSCTMTCMKQ